MSTQAPWLALSVDWQDSDMFENASAEERLAWICLLCHAKTNGRAGVVRAKPGVLVKRYQITKTAALSMMQRAADTGAIEVDDDWTVSIVNWKTYQDPKHRGSNKQVPAGKGLTTKRGGFSKSAKNDATPYPLPLPRDQTTNSPPTPPGAECETDPDHFVDPNQKGESGAAAPPNKPVKPHRTNSKQAEADALELYAAYPLHKGKLAALKAIRKAMRTCPALELLPKVVEYAGSQYVQERIGTPNENFIPRPATWFNEGRWMDETGGKSRGEEWLEEKS